MSKKSKKKSNLKDNSFEASSLEHFESAFKDSIDENQRDIEDQIAEEEKAIEVEMSKNRPQFKDPKKSITLAGSSSPITNDTLTERLMYYLIDENICSPSDFKS